MYKKKDDKRPNEHEKCLILKLKCKNFGKRKADLFKKVG